MEILFKNGSKIETINSENTVRSKTIRTYFV